MRTAVQPPTARALAPVFTGWIERARPQLGTLVRIGVHGLPEAAALAALERAFGAVAALHELLSFHEPGSELSRLNREAAMAAVPVNPHTRAVLALASEVAAASDGVFDATVAPQLVEWGLLPAPPGAPLPDPLACWQDVVLCDRGVRFARPLWLDLGGIAKGYAVDAAIEALHLPPQAQAYVDAGGDLRVAGPEPRRVLLNVPGHTAQALPMVEITDGAVASSGGGGAASGPAGAGGLGRLGRLGGLGGLGGQAPAERLGPHVHGGRACAVAPERFASVVASRCAVADALTKVVLAVGVAAAPALAQFGATGHFYSPESGWQTCGTRE